MRKREQDEGGAAAVEFGLLVIPFCFLLFGMIQFGWYFWTAEGTNSAAREVARRVVVGDCWNEANQMAVALEHSPNVTVVDVAPDPAGLDVGDEVVVTITSDSDIIAFLPDVIIPGTVTRTYEARMEVDQPSDADLCAGP